jgi:sulfite reductase alpha subunit-like flavoprotein
MDESLTALGANKALDRVDLDIDFEEPFEEWLGKYAAYLESK